MPDQRTDQILAGIRAMSDADISDIAAQATGDASAAVNDGWTANPMSAVSVGPGTLGFFKVEGTATTSTGNRPWSAIVKAIETGTDDAIARYQDPDRELGAYRSDLASGRFPGMKPAACYRTDELPDGSVLLWLQDLGGTKHGNWTADDYATAAYEIGRFNGSLPADAAAAFDWADLTGASDRRLGGPYQRDAGMFRDSLSSPPARRVFRDIGMDRAVELRSNLLQLVEASTGFPLLFSHNDCHTRNLFLDTSGNSNVLYAIDWASAGVAPAGVDGGTIIGSGLSWSAEEANLILEVEKDVFEAYYAGLCESGWSQPPSQVRFVFLTLSLTYTLQLISAVHQATSKPRYANMLRGRLQTDLDDVADQFGDRMERILPLVDEALSLAAANT